MAFLYTKTAPHGGADLINNIFVKALLSQSNQPFLVSVEAF